MKYAIFSDVHGKLDKLNKFFKECEKYNIENYISLGDNINWGIEESDNLCLDILKEKRCIAIKGNHDIYNSNSKLNSDNLDFITKLPINIGLGELILFHASLIGEDFNFWDKRRINKEFDELSALGYNIGFCGHTHNPFVFLRTKSEDRDILSNREKKFKLNEDYSYLINPGALINNNYGVFDLENREFIFLKLNI